MNWLRRNWIAAVAVAAICSGPVAGIAVVLAPPSYFATRAPDRPIYGAGVVVPTPESMLSVYNVRTYGAKGDGVTDDTNAIQAALTAAGNIGAICYAPPGNYLVAGSLAVPIGVQFLGSWHGPAETTPGPPSGGTQLWITGGAGNAGGTAAITLNGGPSSMAGFVMYWPNQSSSAATPTAYPWAIQVNGTAPQASNTVRDCFLINPYQGILINGAPRATVSRVYGQPLSVGVSVVGVGDVCRLEDVHFVYLWAMPGTNAQAWQQAHGIAFQFGRSDEQYGDGLFCLGYNVGFQFYNQTATPSPGSAYGEFTRCGVDDCNTGISCSASATNGIRWGDSGFAGRAIGGGWFLNQTGGKLAFSNCAFLQGGNTLTQAGGDLLLAGCTFRDNSTAIALAGTYSIMNGCVVENPSSTTITLSGTGKATLVGNTCIGAAFSSIVSGTASGGTVTGSNN